MTQPVQEPTTQRVVSKLGWGQRQLERRPALTSGGGTTYAYLDDWTFNGTGASIADDTWTSVVTGVNGANDRWFDEFCYDPDGEWSVDYDTGRISNASSSHNYSAWGFVQFDVPDGTLIGVEINGIVGANNTSTAVDSAPFVCVYAERTPITVGGFALRCYQASGGAADLIQAVFTVRRFEEFTDYVCENPP